MKTFYTLLLAFGLCLTSHAQSNGISLLNYDTYYKQATATEKRNLDTYLKGTPYKLIFDDQQQAKSIWNNGSELLMIDINNVPGFNQQLLATYNTEFSKVKAIKINNISAKTGSINIDLSNYPQLEYVIFDIDSLNAVPHLNTLIQNLSVTSQVKVMYRYQMEM